MDTPVEGAGPAEEVQEQANSLTAPPITTGGPCSRLVKHSCRNCSRQTALLRLHPAASLASVLVGALLQKLGSYKKVQYAKALLRRHSAALLASMLVKHSCRRGSRTRCCTGCSQQSTSIKPEVIQVQGPRLLNPGHTPSTGKRQGNFC